MLFPNNMQARRTKFVMRNVGGGGGGIGDFILFIRRKLSERVIERDLKIAGLAVSSTRQTVGRR